MRYLDVISKKYDHYLLAAVVLLCIVGTVMLFSASNSISMDQTQRVTATVYLQAHLKRLLVGIAMMFAAMMIDYRNLKIAAKYLLIGSIALLLITKLSYLLQGNSSPARWLYLGSHSIQTSDIARLAVIIFLAAYMDHYRDQIKDFYNGFAPPIGIMAVVMVLIVIQPDFSTAAMTGLIGFMILFVGGARISHLLATGAASLLVLTPIILMKPYRLQRILTYFYGESAGVEESYQIKQSLISLGNGGFIGLGLGNSLGKNLFLPHHTRILFLPLLVKNWVLLALYSSYRSFYSFFSAGSRLPRKAWIPSGSCWRSGSVSILSCTALLMPRLSPALYQPPDYQCH